MKLSKTQNLTTAEDRERMKVIPYAPAISSINSDPGVDHLAAAKIILRGLRKDFSVMEVIKCHHKELHRCKF